MRPIARIIVQQGSCSPCGVSRGQGCAKFGRALSTTVVTTDKQHRHNPAKSYENYQDEIARYRTDRKVLQQWSDFSIIQKKGRAFDADLDLLNKAQTIYFPVINCTDLNGTQVTVPNNINADVKLVVVSFKHLGFSLVRSWLDPFLEAFINPAHPPNSSTSSTNGTNVPTFVTQEICFIEYSFLSVAKGMFANGIKNIVSKSQYPYTFLSFGGVMVSLCIFLPSVIVAKLYMCTILGVM